MATPKKKTAAQREIEKLEKIGSIALDFAEAASNHMDTDKFIHRMETESNFFDMMEGLNLANKFMNLDKKMALIEKNDNISDDQATRIIVKDMVSLAETFAQFCGKYTDQKTLENLMPAKAKIKTNEKTFNDMNAPFLASLCKKPTPKPKS